jgi:hypothetical protein
VTARDISAVEKRLINTTNAATKNFADLLLPIISPQENKFFSG